MIAHFHYYFSFIQTTYYLFVFVFFLLNINSYASPMPGGELKFNRKMNMRYIYMFLKQLHICLYISIFVNWIYISYMYERLK